MKSIPVRNIKSAESQNAHGLKIRTLHSLLDGSDLFHHLHRHDYYYILLIEKAKGEHEIDFVTYSLNTDRIFLLKPGQVHQLKVSKGGKGFIVQFANELTSEFNASQLQSLRTVFHNSVYDLTKSQASHLKAIFELMLGEYTSQEEQYVEIIKSHLLTAILHLLRVVKGNRTSTSQSSFSQEKLEQLQVLMEKHIVTLKKTSDYAQLLHLSDYQLNSITKSLLGKNCSEVINEYVILEAKRYLLATTNQVSQIADTLGFDDPAYFIRFFKKHVGVTPDSFRKTSQ